MFSLGSNAITMLVVAAAVAAPSAYVGHNFGYGKAAKEFRNTSDMFKVREIFLYHELGAARQAQYDLIGKVETIWDLTGRARREMAAALAAQKAEADNYKLAAAAAIKRLDNAESVEIQTWRNGRVPPELALPICVRDDDNCRTSSTATNADNDLEVRQPTTGNGGGL